MYKTSYQKSILNKVSVKGWIYIEEFSQASGYLEMTMNFYPFMVRMKIMPLFPKHLKSSWSFGVFLLMLSQVMKLLYI